MDGKYRVKKKTVAAYRKKKGGKKITKCVQGNFTTSPATDKNIPNTDESKKMLTSTCSTSVDISCDEEPNNHHTIASQQIQTHLNNLSQWFTNWKIKINESKSSFITFTLRPHSCPAVSINNIDIPHSTEVKYLGLILDRRLTWSPHLKNKRKKLNSRLHLLRPLLRSNLTIPIKIILYKTLLKPIWTYGIVIWGSAKNSNKKTIQAFQNIFQRVITGAPWFVSNESLNNDLKLTSINETASIFYKRFHSKLRDNPNQLINELASLTLPGNPARRLKRNWCRDLIT
ncbi:hypothetical protein AGLY_014132 [Aphis glycines]|uniref:Reverse transcriptase domain-containing protein n=1 Tax=Aphis glycines TaxID=307491 RepID=A0A6G0T5H9_APHGL|nr:hypothetical protein AGLY_014132 [Aphis glycines]